MKTPKKQRKKRLNPAVSAKIDSPEVAAASEARRIAKAERSAENKRRWAEERLKPAPIATGNDPGSLEILLASLNGGPSIEEMTAEIQRKDAELLATDPEYARFRKEMDAIFSGPGSLTAKRAAVDAMILRDFDEQMISNMTPQRKAVLLKKRPDLCEKWGIK